jgi:hypothetical protein
MNIRPCPFCGDLPEITEQKAASGGDIVTILCDNCYDGDWKYSYMWAEGSSKDSVIAKWNDIIEEFIDGEGFQCHSCDGLGTVSGTKCKHCHGYGWHSDDGDIDDGSDDAYERDREDRMATIVKEKVISTNKINVLKIAARVSANVTANEKIQPNELLTVQVEFEDVYEISAKDLLKVAAAGEDEKLTEQEVRDAYLAKLQELGKRVGNASDFDEVDIVVSPTSWNPGWTEMLHVVKDIQG